MKSTYKSYFITSLQIIGVLADLYGLYCFASSFILDKKILNLIGVVGFLVIFVYLLVRWRIVHSKLLSFILNIFRSNNTKEIFDKVVEYEYVNRNEMRFRCEFYVRARYGTLGEYTDRLLWTGGNIEAIEPTESNQNIEFITKPNIDQISLARQTYKIVFQNPLSCHDSKPLKTGLRVESLKDPNGIALPQLVVGIYDITKRLTLRVRFPANFCVENIKKMSYAHFIDENPYMVESGDCIGNGNSSSKYVEMYIKNPIYGGKYAIFWEFCN